MTVDPTALQQARLSIGQIRVCWPMLDDARTTRVSRPSVALSGRAAQARDADLMAERADRDSTISYRALGASPAPLNVAVLDVETGTRDTLTRTAWAIRSDLRQWSRRMPAWPTDTDQLLTWLTEMLDATTAAVVDQAAVELTAAARRVTSAVGHRVDDDWHSHPGRCPVCGNKALHRWAASPDRREWAIECTGQTDEGQPCRCAGDTCPCNRPGARKSSRHLWSAT